METTLADLRAGEKGVIVGFSLPMETQLRFMELGFLEGHEVKLLRIAPLKDPLEVGVLSSKISIRRAEASGIRLKRLG